MTAFDSRRPGVDAGTGPVSWVVWDIGGVFHLWPPRATFEEWAADHGLARDEWQPGLWYGPDIEAANVGELSATDYFERAAARLGVDVKEVQRVIELAFGGLVNRDLVLYLRSRRDRFRSAALSNTWSFGRDLLAANGLVDLFEVIVTSAEEGICKPHPEIYGRTVRRLGTAPSACIFVDDAAENIAAAADLGFRVIQFRSTGQVVSELEEMLQVSD